MAGLIPPHLLEQIRAANDIVDVVGSYLPLKRAGANFRALCPFHREKTPSFNVNPHHQIFKCFGCGKGGDVFTFVREYEGLEFIDAVRRLAERARIPLEFENNPVAQQQKHIKEVLWTIHEQITQRWQAVLANDAAGQLARDYLAKRGVSGEAVKLFRLGAAPEAWDDTVNWARSKGHDLATMEQSGLIIRKEGTDRYYDRFRGRLIFPICDEQGRVIGFSGRILSGDEKVAKYVNSPETPIFAKGKVFFGLDKSKRAILDADSAVICEGQLDLIACFVAGIQNVVAPQGTAFTENHARIIRRFAKEVILCFDSDRAGKMASVRGWEGLVGSGLFQRAGIAVEAGKVFVRDTMLSSDLAIRVALIPSPHDPDSFIKEYGAQAFQQLIQKAEGFFDFFLRRLCETNDLGSDRGRTTIIRELGEMLKKTGSAVLLDTYAQKAALKLGISTEAVRSEFKKSKPTAPRDEGSDEAIEEEPQSPPSAQETQLVRLLLSGDEHVAFVRDHLKSEWVQNPIVLRIVRKRIDAHSGAEQPMASFLSGFGDDPAAQDLISETLADSQTIPQPEKQLSDVLVHLRNDFLTLQLQELTRRLSQPEIDDAERLDLLRQQQIVRASKRQPLVQPT